MAQLGHDDDGMDSLGRDSLEGMAKYGITRVRIDNFHYGGFRYTNLDDAIAEAMRHPPGSHIKPTDASL